MDEMVNVREELVTNKREMNWRRIGQSRGRQMVASPEIHLEGSPSRTFHAKQAIAAGCSFHFNSSNYSHGRSLQINHDMFNSCSHHYHKPTHATAVVNKGSVLAGTKASPKLLRL
jgi:hypothetical protein